MFGIQSICLRGGNDGIFRSIEGSAQGCECEEDFKGLFDDSDMNSNKLGDTVAKRNELLVKFMNGVAPMQLGDYRENTIDVFGVVSII